MITYNPIIKKINSDLFTEQNLSVDVLRLDLIHSEISGNKWFKLKLNLEKAKAQNFKTIVTFGGAYSNHIAATASACKIEGVKSIGVIRGERPTTLNSTLVKATEDGMLLYFVDRETYAKKTQENFQQDLLKLFGEHYLIPEGGNNAEGIFGSAEIIKPEWNYDYIFCACGTGATFSGILASLKPNQILIGISVLKGENTLVNEAIKQLQFVFPDRKFSIKGNEAIIEKEISESCITNSYCFNGYAKLNLSLVEFKTNFEKEFNIPLDYI
ncbi:MAG: pyridoxal-phosphate dependent enzyme, partial [Bacteroidota bacterium]